MFAEIATYEGAGMGVYELDNDIFVADPTDKFANRLLQSRKTKKIVQENRRKLLALSIGVVLLLAFTIVSWTLLPYTWLAIVFTLATTVAFVCVGSRISDHDRYHQWRQQEQGMKEGRILRLKKEFHDPLLYREFIVLYILVE